jgi:hypothetical protein
MYYLTICYPDSNITSFNGASPLPFRGEEICGQDIVVKIIKISNIFG